jgi:hypothetical protein
LRNVLSFSPKDRVDHSVFGPGTIVEIDDRRTTIAFDETGVRKFATGMIQLAASDTPAPARRGSRRDGPALYEK